MNLSRAPSVVGLPLRDGRFFVLSIVLLVLTRLVVIEHIAWTAELEDLLIYQTTGQAVLAGVSPYDYRDHVELRESLRAGIEKSRQDAIAPADRLKGSVVTQSQATWDYFVSSNLPASTALYAVFERVANGSRFVWRLLLILGDVSIFVGLFMFIKVVRAGPMRSTDQIGVFCLTVVNPVLIVSSTAFPEDKQFQTALMLFAAALLMHRRKSPSPPGAGFTTGLVLMLSILFKLFGIFLVPVWLAKIRREGLRFGTLGVMGAIVPLALSLMLFGYQFVVTMMRRGGQDSSGVAAHDSPWVLLPALGPGPLLIAKVLAASLCIAGLGMLLAKRRIDLLNFCAGLAVVFGCVWLSQGAMNREIIVLMFGTACLATICPTRFFQLSVFTVLSTGAIYAAGLIYMHRPPGLVVLVAWEVHAAMALLLTVAYAVALGTLPRIGSREILATNATT